MAAPRHGLACADIGTPHYDASQPRGVAAQREGHLDRVARKELETMKPTGGPTREDCRYGKTPADGGKYNVGVIGNRAQCVDAATESAPAHTK